MRASDGGLSVRRGGIFWRHLSWDEVAGVEPTAQADLLGWREAIYTVYRWRTVRGRGGRVRRAWHRRRVPLFRFSGHIRNGEHLVTLIEQNAALERPEAATTLPVAGDE